MKQRLRNLGACVSGFALAGLFLAPIEAVLTLVLSESDVRAAVAVRFVAVTAALLPLLSGMLGLLAGLASLLVARPIGSMIRWVVSGRARTPEQAALAVDGASDLWASITAAAALVAALAGANFVVSPRFRDPVYQSVAVGLVGLLCALLALGVRLALGPALRWIGAAHWPLVSAPFASMRGALATLALIGFGGGAATLVNVAFVREIVPVRLSASVVVLFLSGLGVVAWRGERPWIGAPTARWGAQLAWVALCALSLVRLGADAGVKYLVALGSPVLERASALVRLCTDLDADGYGALLGEGDCAPMDGRIHPGALEIPDNGKDDDCVGGDFSFRRILKTAGKARPVPEAFRRTPNVLLITLDAVRADHTGFHGYGRPTTPNLDRLARESAVFARAYAPSAGTVASVPAILASRFFHSQMAVGPERPRKPPRILPENLLVAEIMKAGGYRTGAVLGHDYFNDWGLEQGFDHYDNSLGPRREPHSVTSHKLTDKATAFIASQRDKKWFLWVHYLDAHSEYERHAGFDFGRRPVDLYDGEIRFVDEHVGRLLDFLRRSGQWSRTVLALTADHGDAFGEHGRTHHGSTLFEEMIHVPLLVRVPDLPGRRFDQVVSGLDVVPTAVDLAGLASAAHDFEGKSLVPTLFYDERDPGRAVFAETNWPSPLRALVLGRHKLIYDLKNNLYQMFDLGADPVEKKNRASRDVATLEKLKTEMWAWLSRAVYRRAKANQAEMVRTKDILDRLPPGASVARATFDQAIELEGFELDPAAVRSPTTLPVVTYLRAPRGATTRYRLHARIELVQKDGRTPAFAKDVHVPLGGFYPTPVWKPEELIRERFSLKIPARWKGAFEVRLALENETGQVVSASGDGVVTNWVRLAAGQLR